MEPSSVFDKNKLRRMKAWAKHCLRGIFELSQRAGFDVLPRNFYSSIPNIKERGDRAIGESRSRCMPSQAQA
jgi:hypothetical protein